MAVIPLQGERSPTLVRGLRRAEAQILLHRKPWVLSTGWATAADENPPRRSLSTARTRRRGPVFTATPAHIQAGGRETGFGNLFPGSSASSDLEEEMATRSSILAWEIPWTEEPAGLVQGAAESQKGLSS